MFIKNESILNEEQVCDCTESDTCIQCYDLYWESEDTAELEGSVLDWAVAKCEGLSIIEDPMGFKNDHPSSLQAGFWVWSDNVKLLIGVTGRNGYSPSTNWKLGGQIIERANISLNAPCSAFPLWAATLNYGKCMNTGNTALISAMRSYVSSVLGNKVKVPDYFK